MTPDNSPDDELDILLSSVFDGEADTADEQRVTTDPELSARLADLAELRDEITDVEPLTAVERDDLMSGVWAELDEASGSVTQLSASSAARSRAETDSVTATSTSTGVTAASSSSSASPSSSSAATVTDLGQVRRSRMARFAGPLVGVAAAIGVLGVGANVLNTGDTAEETASLSYDDSADGDASAAGASGEMDDGGDEMAEESEGDESGDFEQEMSEDDMDAGGDAGDAAMLDDKDSDNTASEDAAPTEAASTGTEMEEMSDGDMSDGDMSDGDMSDGEMSDDVAASGPSPESDASAPTSLQGTTVTNGTQAGLEPAPVLPDARRLAFNSQLNDPARLDALPTVPFSSLELGEEVALAEIGCELDDDLLVSPAANDISRSAAARVYSVPESPTDSALNWAVVDVIDIGSVIVEVGPECVVVALVDSAN